MEVNMKKALVFSVNESALMAAVRRRTLGVLPDDRPIAVSRPELFDDSVVKPKPEGLAKSSTKERP